MGCFGGPLAGYVHQFVTIFARHNPTLSLDGLIQLCPHGCE